ncbi:MAG TPA: protein translocase subunit SecD [Verrucomicrobiae bacterium]
MNSSHLWKLLLVVFVVAWSVNEMNPPTSRNLIQVFEEKAVNNTDTNFTAIVAQAKKLEAENPTRVYGSLWDAIGTNDIASYFPTYAKGQTTNAKRTILNRLQRDASGQIRLGLDLQGGTAFLVGVDVDAAVNNAQQQGTNAVTLSEIERAHRKQEALTQAVEVLRKRVDRFGVSEPIIQPQGEKRILIQMPGLSEVDREAVRETLQKVAHLEFRMVHRESDRYLQQGLVPPGYEILREEVSLQDGTKGSRAYVVSKKASEGLTGKYVQRAGVALNPITSKPEIHLTFDAEGATKFGNVTKAHVGEQLAIVLDGELYSAPNINEPILGGNCQITGNYDLKEAYRLANALENPLEAPVEIEEERSVDPSLGKDSIESGIRASMYGIILVAGFMLVYYMLAGLIANIALMLNIVILIGVMCSIDATFTLPGIAGIVLTIGMAVDANVLIFERMREELEAGKALRAALKAGYEKAFSTILDANVTTLISSVLLIYFGTGPVQGFGVTLSIGVAVSMFTALVVTRLIFDWLIYKNVISSLKMFKLVGKTNFDFLKLAKPAFILSWTLVIVGSGYGLYRGSHALGVDFKGGDNAIFEYTQKVEQTEIRNVLEKAELGEFTIQYQSGEKERLSILTEFEKGSKVESILKSSFEKAGFKLVSLDKVGPAVGMEIVKSAVVATLLSLLGILVYVALRYEFSFALGAVVAVLHDVFMTLGWFFLTDRQLSATMVAAILTIIGFSINDTIVIFDRIREHLKMGARGSFKEIMNSALNETLSRTIITSGTVLLSTGALYIWGGGVINDFAFTFLVGILTGCYSSIYIAAAIVLWYHKGEKPKTSGSAVVMDRAVETVEVR